MTIFIIGVVFKGCSDLTLFNLNSRILIFKYNFMFCFSRFEIYLDIEKFLHTLSFLKIRNTETVLLPVLWKEDKYNFDCKYFRNRTLLV